MTTQNKNYNILTRIKIFVINFSQKFRIDFDSKIYILSADC